jgi:hypothetical protein
MAIPGREQIDALLSKDGECVSILVPTHRSGRDVQQAKIRLKNLLREAESRLAGNQLPKDQIEETLRPAQELLGDELPWRSLEDGLAVYLAPGFSQLFTVPLAVEETLVVGRRFYVLPLLQLLGNHGDFFLLALSANSVRLYAANRFEIREIDLPGVPKRLTDAVGSDFEQDSVQVHTVRPGSGGAIVHGHGAGQGEDEKEEATRFCLRVDAGLRRFLLGAGNGARPLVVAAAEPLASIYAQVTHYSNLLPGGVAGNPETLSPEELRARAWAKIEAALDRELGSGLARCRELLGTGRASSDLREIVLAAFDGRADTLFVAQGTRRWGSFDSAARRVEIAAEPGPMSDELLNLAAGMTVGAGGAVHLVARDAVPEKADAAAIFRY